MCSVVKGGGSVAVWKQATMFYSALRMHLNGFQLVIYLHRFCARAVSEYRLSQSTCDFIYDGNKVNEVISD